MKYMVITFDGYDYSFSDYDTLLEAKNAKAKEFKLMMEGSSPLRENEVMLVEILESSIRNRKTYPPNPAFSEAAVEAAIGRLVQKEG